MIFNLNAWDGKQKTSTLFVESRCCFPVCTAWKLNVLFEWDPRVCVAPEILLLCNLEERKKSSVVANKESQSASDTSFLRISTGDIRILVSSASWNRYSGQSEASKEWLGADVTCAHRLYLVVIHSPHQVFNVPQKASYGSSCMEKARWQKDTDCLTLLPHDLSMVNSRSVTAEPLYPAWC